MRAGDVVGERVSLRAIREDDLAAIEEWFADAARAAFEDRGLEELRSEATNQVSGVLVVERAREDEPIGLLEYVVSEGWLAVPFIALAKPYRGWGYGSEAARLLEEWAAPERLARRFRAEVDVRNGLGLYFWLRLGYRPERPGDDSWRWAREPDRMRMVRSPTEQR